MTGLAFLICYPVLLYLTGCDLRHNKQVWKNSLCAKLFSGGKSAAGALSARQAAAARLASHIWFEWKLLLLVFLPFPALWTLSELRWAVGYMESFLFFLALFVLTAGLWLATLLGALVVVLLLLLPLAWLLDRTWVLLRDLVPLTDQLSTLRAGGAAQPLTLPEGSDLSAAAGDLNRVQEGLRSAVAEQMKSERMKVEFIANVSHDLKTPLTSVVSYAALLGEEEDLPPM